MEGTEPAPSPSPLVEKRRVARWWQVAVGVGVTLFVIGAALSDVPILALCGIPLGVFGLVILLLGLMAAGNGSAAGALGALGLVLGLILVALATHAGIGWAWDWALAQQRGTAAASPSYAGILAMFVGGALAALAGAGAVQLRGWDRRGSAAVGVGFFLLPLLSVLVFLVLALVFDMAITA